MRNCEDPWMPSGRVMLLLGAVFLLLVIGLGISPSYLCDQPKAQSATVPAVSTTAGMEAVGAVSRKTAVAQNQRLAFTDLRAAAIRCQRVRTIIIASGYDMAGVDPIEDSDLTGYRGLTAAKLNAACTLTGTFGTFFTDNVNEQIDAFIAVE